MIHFLCWLFACEAYSGPRLHFWAQFASIVSVFPSSWFQWISAKRASGSCCLWSQPASKVCRIPICAKWHGDSENTRFRGWHVINFWTKHAKNWFSHFLTILGFSKLFRPPSWLRSIPKDELGLIWKPWSRAFDRHAARWISSFWEREIVSQSWRSLWDAKIAPFWTWLH